MNLQRQGAPTGAVTATGVQERERGCWRRYDTDEERTEVVAALKRSVGSAHETQNSAVWLLRGLRRHLEGESPIERLIFECDAREGLSEALFGRDVPCEEIIDGVLGLHVKIQLHVPALDADTSLACAFQSFGDYLERQKSDSPIALGDFVPFRDDLEPMKGRMVLPWEPGEVPVPEEIGEYIPPPAAPQPMPQPSAKRVKQEEADEYGWLESQAQRAARFASDEWGLVIGGGLVIAGLATAGYMVLNSGEGNG